MSDSMLLLKECGFEAKETKFCVQLLKFIGHVTLIKVLHIPVSQFTYLVNRGNSALYGKRIVLLTLINKVFLGDIEVEMKCEESCKGIG